MTDQSDAAARGSLWRKWDFQVHTPASHLNNQFGSDWDGYVQKLFRTAIAKDISAIALTDYFTIDGYQRVRLDYLDKPDKLAALFIPFKETRQLRGGQGHNPVGRRRPDEATLFEPLGIKRHARAVVPDDLYQRTGATAEDIYRSPAKGSRRSACCTISARPCMPFLISVWSMAIHTRAPDGITAAPSAPPSPAPAMLTGR